MSYSSDLQAKKKRTDQETHLLSSVKFLTSTIASDYRHTLAKIERLTSYGEITFDLLYAILLPLQLMVAKCAITGLPRVFELVSWTKIMVDGQPMYQLNLESVDLIDQTLTKGVVVGRVQTTVFIKRMRGTVRIDTLDAYPLKFHPDEKGLREGLLLRGKKWVGLIGTHHMQYDGVAAIKVHDTLLRHNVSCLSVIFSRMLA